MKGRICLGIAMSAILVSVTASADSGLELRGTLYKLRSNRQEKLYTWEMKVCANLWTSNYYRLDGTLAVEDRTQFDAQRLSEYSYVRHTIGESSSVKVTGRQLRFDYKFGDTTKSATKTTNAVFLTGPAVFNFIQEHLKELREGREFEFKYGVLDQLDYFTFKLSSKSRPGSETSLIAVSATSPFVRMAIDPIYVTLSKEGKFRSITGRTIVMEMAGHKFKPIDADLVVESEASTNCDALQSPHASRTLMPREQP
jgi:hypothetical protein